MTNDYSMYRADEIKKNIEYAIMQTAFQYKDEDNFKEITKILSNAQEQLFAKFDLA